MQDKVQPLAQAGPTAKSGLEPHPCDFCFERKRSHIFSWEMKSSWIMAPLYVCVTPMYSTMVLPCPKVNIGAIMGHHPISFIDKLREGRDCLCHALNLNKPSPSCGQ